MTPHRILICGKHCVPMVGLYSPTFVSGPTVGDLVWAHEETRQLFDGLAEVVVSAPLRLKFPSLHRGFFFSP